MKLNKTLIILSLLLVFCISLGAVSATDSADMSVNEVNSDCVDDSVNIQTADAGGKYIRLAGRNTCCIIAICMDYLRRLFVKSRFTIQAKYSLVP